MLLNGPSSFGGYRTIWHSIQLEGIHVPRAIVQRLLSELDPSGTELRKGHRLKRRM